MTPEIPVLAIPILNRGDLLTRCISSLDYPIGKLVIINNGQDKTVARAIQILTKQRANVDVITPGYNLGVSTSWNKAINDYPAPWWFIASNDIKFAPGDLQKMVEAYYTAKDPTVLFGNHGWAFFLITRKCVDTCGRFDENLRPAYFEDCEMMRRIKLSGYDGLNVPNVNATHGEPPYGGSSTIKSNPTLDQKNGITFEMNRDYYIRKWGGPPNEETFPKPFNRDDWPLSRWEIEEDRMAQMQQIW